MAVKYDNDYFHLATQAMMTTKVKQPLLEVFHIVFGRSSLPEKWKAYRKLNEVLKTVSLIPPPTKENTWHPNSHNLIDLRDWLLERLSHSSPDGLYKGLHPTRLNFIRQIFNLSIIIYDYDPPWRWIIDSALTTLKAMDWKPRGFSDDWKDNYSWWQE